MADTANDGFDLTQFYQIFFEEAGENLEQMEQLLLNLDLDTVDDETLNAIFRCAHSIKGGAATFGFEDVAELTHQMESLLDKLRRHELVPTAPMVDVLLESSDALKGLLARHQGLGGEPPETSGLVARIRQLASGQAAAPVAPPPPPPPPHHRRPRPPRQHPWGLAACRLPLRLASLGACKRVSGHWLGSTWQTPSRTCFVTLPG